MQCRIFIIRDCIVEAYQKVDFINFNKDMAFCKRYGNK